MKCSGNMSAIQLLKELIKASEKAANIARVCRQDEHLFGLLIQEKPKDESNARFEHDFKTLADCLIQESVKYDIGKLVIWQMYFHTLIDGKFSCENLFSFQNFEKTSEGKKIRISPTLVVNLSSFPYRMIEMRRQKTFKRCIECMLHHGTVNLLRKHISGIERRQDGSIAIDRWGV